MVNAIQDTLTGIANKARRLTLKSIFHAGSGHPGGSLSCVDILVALYFQHMQFNERKPEDNTRDRFVLSKGHAVAALYSVLVLRGLVDSMQLGTFRKLGSQLQGHPYSGSLAWIDGTSGSLGQGFSAALGIAIGLRLQKIPARSYVLIGDGELQEGMIWEGALFAAQQSLSNVCVILDYNRLQSDKPVAEIMAIEPLRDKWQAFGWHVVECDGHDFVSVDQALNVAKAELNKPTLVIANTVKGKGVSFMEDKPNWHGALTLSEADYIAAIKELGVTESELGNYLDATWWGDTA